MATRTSRCGVFAPSPKLPDTTPFELILVDDASPDHAASLVDSVPGVRLIRLSKNVGYLGACNAGAAAARGRHLLLLNNDTEVRPGFLDALVRLLDDKSVGVVGSKLVYPDGRLQEAGGIIFRDGTGWNYGRGESPSRFEYAFVREVDYCSGASLLVRGELWQSLGGFDERYSPAYYEDVDLCFSAREAGYRVLYQPASVVIHHEGASHGTDTASGTKRYQEINRHKFVDKWHDELAAQQLPHSGPVVARDRCRGSRVPRRRSLRSYPRPRCGFTPHVPAAPNARRARMLSAFPTRQPRVQLSVFRGPYADGHRSVRGTDRRPSRTSVAW